MNISGYKTREEVSAYEDGLNDAWLCAKKILRLGFNEASAIFKELITDDEVKYIPDIEIFERYAPMDAIVKIMAYEKEHVTRENIIDTKLNELINAFDVKVTKEELIEALYRIGRA